MRLSESQATTIAQVLRQHFGADSEIRLFGSRLDDNARGGDIDLYIEPELTDGNELAIALIKSKVALIKTLGDQKIDLVINRKGSPSLPIYQHARETGVIL
ncbi:nucleotidyltransferase domain-containing protein [Oceanospirillum sp. HFRX-1_2]